MGWRALLAILWVSVFANGVAAQDQTVAWSRAEQAGLVEVFVFTQTPCPWWNQDDGCGRQGSRGIHLEVLSEDAPQRVVTDENGHAVLQVSGGSTPTVLIEGSVDVVATNGLRQLAAELADDALMEGAYGVDTTRSDTQVANAVDIENPDTQGDIRTQDIQTQDIQTAESPPQPDFDEVLRRMNHRRIIPRAHQAIRRADRQLRRRRSRARRRTPSVQDARAVFDGLVLHGVALAALHVEPADASGVLRRWDASFVPFQDKPVFISFTQDCEAKEVHLLWYAAGNVLAIRGAIYDQYSNISVEEMAADFAVRRLLADEAARRRREHLSCEDMPVLHEVEISSILGFEPSERDFGVLIRIALEGASSIPQHIERSAETRACGGHVDVDGVQALMTLHRREVRACFEQHQRSNEQRALRLQVVVDRDGSVGRIRVGGSLDEDSAAQCVAGLARRWRFPRPTNGACAEVNLPFVLTRP